jgi:hypothetical protein
MARNAAILAAMVAVAAVASGEAQAQARVEVGVLTCTVRGGSGFIIGSTKDLRCRFNKPGRDEFYHGTISKFGLDIGATKQTAIAWAVFAPTARLPPGSLNGNYGGVSAEATVGLGVGANALIGGSNKNIILQPLSVQAQQGLNIAAGVAASWSWRTWTLPRWYAVRRSVTHCRGCRNCTRPRRIGGSSASGCWRPASCGVPRTTPGCSASLPSAKVGSISSTCCRRSSGGA